MNGMDGLETARKLRAGKFRGFLIFITVLKEMVFQSFEVQAYDYLVKPVDEKQFGICRYPYRQSRFYILLNALG